MPSFRALRYRNLAVRGNEFKLTHYRFDMLVEDILFDAISTLRYYRQWPDLLFTIQNFLLFVRPKKDDPFLFPGSLRYVSHSGSRPMNIYWDLEYPMPVWFFEIWASLRAA